MKIAHTPFEWPILDLETGAAWTAVAGPECGISHAANQCDRKELTIYTADPSSQRHHSNIAVQSLALHLRCIC